jgi:hypothetical protein
VSLVWVVVVLSWVLFAPLFWLFGCLGSLYMGILCIDSRGGDSEGVFGALGIEWGYGSTDIEIVVLWPPESLVWYPDDCLGSLATDMGELLN